MTDKIVVCGGGVLLTPSYLKNLDLKRSSLLYQEPRKNSNFDVGVIGQGKGLESLSLAVREKSWTEILYLSGDKSIQSFYNVVSKPEFKTKFFFEAINSWSHRKSLVTKQNESEIIVKVNNLKTLKRINEG